MREWEREKWGGRDEGVGDVHRGIKGKDGRVQPPHCSLAPWRG